MKTSRMDIEKNKRQIKCFNSTSIGYSTYILTYNDLFSYKETYEDGTFTYRLACCKGQVKPANGKEWLILCQASNDMKTFTYERWVKPCNVVEILPKENANQNILKFFDERLKSDGLKERV